MSASRTLLAVAALGLVASCGGSGNDAKSESFEEALGLDEASIQARQAKVQEAVRVCMKEQGFDYIPIDPSQGGMRFSMGPGAEDADPKFRRTKGYGITTMFADLATREPRSNDDPNAAIRDALSEADRNAYDIALHGQEAQQVDGDGPRGGIVMRREVGGGDGPSLSDMGCFGKAQQEVPGGPEQLMSSVRDLMQRVDGDPRLARANSAWASCMAGAGFDQFEKPRDIPDYLFEKLQALTGSDGDGVQFEIGGDIDQAALSTLQHEELALARADDDCAKRTGLTKIAKQVREEAEQRFLDEHPDLTGK